jgi:hypothetical protein
MNAWYFVAAVLLGIAAAGCRTNISQDLLEQELRMQEDKIYELQGLVDEYEARLDSCARENQSLLKETVENPSPRSESRRKKAGDHGLALPEVEVPGGAVPPYEGPPVISPPDPDVPEGESAPESEPAPPYNMRLPNSSATPGDRSQLPEFEMPADEELPAGDKTASDDTVTQITLNRKLTGGHNADGQPGDDGLMVVVEPLDAKGDLLEIPGEVSVVVLDPAQEGEAAHSDGRRSALRTPLAARTASEPRLESLRPLHDAGRQEAAGGKEDRSRGARCAEKRRGPGLDQGRQARPGPCARSLDAELGRLASRQGHRRAPRARRRSSQEQRQACP